MASSHLFILVTLAIVAPCILATDFVVGDDKGWTINFDYQTWAQGKQFYVGDKLVFKYPKGVHNVHKMNGTGFQQCAAPLDSVPLTSRNDVVTLATPGRKWYICGVGQHCKAGNQKLLITVMPSSAPSPSPSYTASSPCTSIPYTSAATGTTVFKYPKGVHNVHKVNGTGFQQCAAPLDSVPLTSGNDVVTLATPGRKWYICGVGQHCKAGNQKLLITVMPSSARSPSPSYTASSPSTSIPYTSAATGISGTRYGWRMTVVFGFLALLTA